MHPNQSQSSLGQKALRSVLFLLLLSLPVLAWLNRYGLYDWWRLRNYSPPAKIQQLAAETTMNNGGRKVFYAQHPEIVDKNALNANCSQGEYTIVLGCYVPTKGIFLYDVTDSRLNGIEEVTAAHEMLHAEYERMSPSERKKVDELTAQAYAQVTDQRIKSTVEQYRKHDSRVVPNELHSILGTEVRDLPPELEAHYKKYFNDRQAIVKLSDKYESEFVARQQQVEDYDKQLATLKIQIDGNETELNLQSSALSSRRRELEGSSRSDPQAYNAQVDSFNAAVRSYNSLVEDTKGLINQYNDIVAKRNELAVEVNDLAKAIDSRPSNLQSQ